MRAKPHVDLTSAPSTSVGACRTETSLERSSSGFDSLAHRQLTRD